MMPKSGKIGMKKKVLATMFEKCLRRGDMVFNNSELREVSIRVGFANHHDAVKIDNSDLLPDIMKERDYFVVHLGGGWHRFVPGISKAFHRFEEIPATAVIPWEYRRSVLNEVNTSESNILSVGINHRLLHHFLYGDTAAAPKIYNAHRTKKSVVYTIDGEEITADNLQMELDMTCELAGRVTVFEGKNNFPENFAVYQLFHPYLYYNALREEKNLPIKSIDGCYFLRADDGKNSVVRIYLYTFDGVEMSSIKLAKSAAYRLVKK